ncbi:MAG: hypothetical protein WCB11_18655 [Terriglobales bacterium]
MSGLRSIAVVCGKTFTFLPLFSLPYTHYSLLARGYALRRRFVEHFSWEKATPMLKDSNRVSDPSTLRRWANGVDRSQLVLSLTWFRAGHAHAGVLLLMSLL